MLTALTLAWAVHLSADFPNFVPGIALPLAALAITVIVVTIVAQRMISGGRTRRAAWPAALCCALMLAIPATWSLSVFDSKYAGSSGNANAGGYTGGMFNMAKWKTALSRNGTAQAKGRAADAPAFNPFGPPTGLSAAQDRLLTYLSDHRDGARYLVATESWGTASPYILDDEAPVLPMGGFSGAAGFPQPPQFRAMVTSGEVRYVLLAGHGMHLPGSRAAPRGGKAPTQAATDLSRITAAVTKHCRLVPATAYGAVPQETAPLYKCG